MKKVFLLLIPLIILFNTCENLIEQNDQNNALAEISIAEETRNIKAVILFSKTRYKKKKAVFTIGKYDVNLLKKAGRKNNDAESIKVNKGYKATLFDGNDFTGYSIVTDKDIAVLDKRIRNKVSSLIVEKTGNGNDDDDDDDNDNNDDNDSANVNIIAFEPENAELPETWKNHIPGSSLPGYSGDGYIEYTGNNLIKDENQISFELTVENSGNYQLIMRSAIKYTGPIPDQSISCFIRLVGANGWQGEFSQFISRSINFWKWGGKAEHDHIRETVIYKLYANQPYTFQIRGKTRRFNIDRIVIFNKDLVTVEEATRLP